jgi:hypothetical protein
MRSFLSCTAPNIIRMSKSRRIRWEGMQHAWGRREMHTVFEWESQKERDQ